MQTPHHVIAARGFPGFCFELPDPDLQITDLTGQGDNNRMRQSGNVRRRARIDCCPGDLIATNRIVGRVTASAIASASPASVLPRLT